MLFDSKTSPAKLLPPTVARVEKYYRFGLRGSRCFYSNNFLETISFLRPLLERADFSIPISGRDKMVCIQSMESRWNTE